MLATASLMLMPSHAIRSDVVVSLSFRFGDGSALVFEKHADIVSVLVRSLGVTLDYL